MDMDKWCLLRKRDLRSDHVIPIGWYHQHCVFQSCGIALWSESDPENQRQFHYLRMTRENAQLRSFGGKSYVFDEIFQSYVLGSEKWYHIYVVFILKLCQRRDNVWRQGICWLQGCHCYSWYIGGYCLRLEEMCLYGQWDNRLGLSLLRSRGNSTGNNRFGNYCWF